jgi:hypothetical protein
VVVGDVVVGEAACVVAGDWAVVPVAGAVVPAD